MTKRKVGEKFRNDHFRILLSFSPSFDEAKLNKLKSNEIKKKYKKGLEILDYLDDDFNIEIGHNNISFTRLILDQEIEDFYNNKAILWGNQLFQLAELLSSDGRKMILEKVFKGAEEQVNNMGIVFTEDLEDALINEVKNKFRDLGFQIWRVKV